MLLQQEINKTVVTLYYDENYMNVNFPHHIIMWYPLFL